MNTTVDSRILCTDWFTNPLQPLLEFKVYFAKINNILFYTVARRGKSAEALNLNDGLSGIQSVILSEAEEYEDNSGEQFDLLKKHLDKKQ